MSNMIRPVLNAHCDYLFPSMHANVWDYIHLYPVFIKTLRKMALTFKQQMHVTNGKLLLMKNDE
jgi:hypothetical protein